MNKTFALERTVHFLSEKRNKPYRCYGAVSIAAEKCAGRQELPQNFWLCQEVGRRGA